MPPDKKPNGSPVHDRHSAAPPRVVTWSHPRASRGTARRKHRDSFHGKILHSQCTTWTAQGGTGASAPNSRER